MSTSGRDRTTGGRSSPRHVVVLGGGVSGLATAWRLLADPEIAATTPTHRADAALGARLEEIRRDLRVTVVESRDRLGGNIRSEHDGGFVVEWGPNGFLDNAPETPRLCRLLGIEERVLPARDAAARRFLYVRGRLRPLPLSAGAFLASDILSLGGRLRVLKEPFVPGRPSEEESVFEFASRRIGPEAAGILVDAMVSGVFGGDSRRLNLASAFPKMYAMEREHGGLVRAMIARGREARRKRREDARAGGMRPEPSRNRRSGATAGPAGPGGVLTSFDQGFEVLIHVLADALRATGRCEIATGSPAVELTPGNPWSVRLENGRPLEADAVVAAIPSRHAGALARPFDPELCTTIQSIPEAPLVVVGLAYRVSDLPAPLDGFGFLVPRGQGPRFLGVLWDSSIYAHRAPAGMVLLRAMLGGAHDPEAIGLTDEEILTLVQRDLVRTMNLDVTPVQTWILRHRHGIPQYTSGHPERLRAIASRAAAWPGLRFTGNSYRGISVNHCVEESIGVARAVLAGGPVEAGAARAE